MAGLQVLDLGLDFKTYQNYRDDQGRQLLGNQFQFEVKTVASSFYPTCGLLVGILHHAIATQGSPTALLWLEQYEKLQLDFLQSVSSRSPSSTPPPSTSPTTSGLTIQLPSSLALAAHAAGQQSPQVGRSSSQGQSVTPPPTPQTKAAMAAIEKIRSKRCDLQLIEELLVLLDQQTGLHGHNMPSQRKPMRDPKIALCNLHISDGKCNQEFLCNQLHMRKTAQHRTDFFAHLTDVLRKRNIPDEQIIHRLKDAIFFSKYGNRVSVQDRTGAHSQFFKTTYTKGRLFHALGLVQNQDGAVISGSAPTPCPGPPTCNGMTNEDCPGVHIPPPPPNERGGGGGRSNPKLNLADAQRIAGSIHVEADELVCPKVASPTTLKWNAAIDAFVGHGDQHGLSPGARRPPDVELIKSLEREAKKGGFPGDLSDETITPLVQEFHEKRFEDHF